MTLTIEPVALAEIEKDIRCHLAALPGWIDVYLEAHIVGSIHFRLHVAGEPAGFASVHDGALLTQFVVDEPHRRSGQALFREMRERAGVREALVPTNDEYFVAHALDDYRRLVMQAYFFRELPGIDPLGEAHEWSLALATPEDSVFIREESGGFFDDLERRIAEGQIFLAIDRDERAGIGIMEVSRFYDAVASIGMFVPEARRRQGAGTATIALLRRECHRRGFRAIAGCAFTNHASRLTLQRASMYSPTRLLRFEF
jgi:GNAT superfamily N-acetyltransferase